MNSIVPALVLLGLVAVAPAVAAEDDFVVRLPDAEGAETADDLVAHADETQMPVVEEVESGDGEILRRFWLTNAVLVRGDADLRASLDDRDEVRVHDNHVFAAPTQNATTDAEVKPGVEQVNATGVWDGFGTRGDGVSVAVLDTGVDASHPDIELRTHDPDDETYPGGWSEFNRTGARLDSTPRDSASHGTHVSGTVAGGNASGTAIGVAPDAELMHSKVFDGGTGSFAAILAGLEWSVDQDADVLSLSFGVDCDESSVYVRDMIEPVRNAQAAGSFVVASTGNNGEGCSSSPGNVYDSLSVGAVDSEGNVPRFSSGEEIDTAEAWGEAAPSDWPMSYVVPDVTAPGVRVLSALPDGGYGRMDGTSMAAPHVSGVAALVESSTDRDVSPDQHRAVLLETAVNGGEPDARRGVGEVDAYAAVAAAQDEVDVDEPLPVNTSDAEADDEADEEGLPGFTAVGALVALLAVVLRKTTCGMGDTV